MSSASDRCCLRNRTADETCTVSLLPSDPGLICGGLMSSQLLHIFNSRGHLFILASNL